MKCAKAIYNRFFKHGIYYIVFCAKSPRIREIKQGHYLNLTGFFGFILTNLLIADWLVAVLAHYLRQ